MIRLSLPAGATSRLSLSSAPLGVVPLRALIARIDAGIRPIGTIRIPLFPETVEELGLMGVDGFLMGADGTILQGADA